MSFSAAPFDKCDAAYIFAGLVDIYRLAADKGTEGPGMDIEQLTEHHSGECFLMAYMLDTAVQAAQAISATVDFDRADLGMFAYDHLDTTQPGGLIYFIWANCIQQHNSITEAVSIYVRSQGWPLKA